MASNYIPDQRTETGFYLQQTPIFDVHALFETEVTSPEFKELLVRLYQQVNNMSRAINAKDTGIYLNEEFRSGRNWFPKVTAQTNYTSTQLDERPSFRMSIEGPPLPNAGVILVPHNIPLTASVVAGVSPYVCVGFYGWATKPDTAGVGIRWIPLPYSSNTANANIEMYATATDIVVTTAIDYSAYTKTFFVLEYLKK